MRSSKGFIKGTALSVCSPATELNCEIYKSKRKCWKIKSVFVIRAALWAEKHGSLPWIFSAGAENYARKTCGCGQHWRPFVSSFECQKALVTVKICVLCGWWFSVWYSVGDILKLRCSWRETVASYTLLAAVPWDGPEHSRRKAWLCVYFNWLKKRTLDVSFWHQSVSTTIFEIEKSWTF